MDIVAVSHLRWDFVFQRPQQLLSRAARDGRVLYVEEPRFGDHEPHLECTRSATGVVVAVPKLPEGLSPADETALQRRLLASAISQHVGAEYVLWYYTPMAVALTHDLKPCAVVYDCMDELSAFAGAPPELGRHEE